MVKRDVENRAENVRSHEIMKTEILHEDKDILVIYKPAGLATQTAKIGQADVVSELKNYLSRTQQNPYLGVIHRLDQPVEGLLVFAKSKKAAADLTAQLQKQGEGGLHKHYYAVVCGKPDAAEGELVDYIRKGVDNRAVIVEREVAAQSCGECPKDVQSGKAATSGEQVPGDAKKAVLRYRTQGLIAPNGSESNRTALEQLSSDSISLLDIHILTGRFHQIRAQMSHAGLPLLGDTKYGSEESKAQGKSLGVQNVALCAYRLELIHPGTKKKMQFETTPKGKVFSFFF